jgi:hypothetical protein
MAKKQVDVGALALAVLIGAVAGLAIGFGGAAIGVPTKLIGPLAGAVTGGLVPIIYGIRTRPRPSGG